MLARWIAVLGLLSLGLLSPGGAGATGSSKGTETGQTATSSTADHEGAGAKTDNRVGRSQGNAPGQSRSEQSASEKERGR